MTFDYEGEVLNNDNEDVVALLTPDESTVVAKSSGSSSDTTTTTDTEDGSKGTTDESSKERRPTTKPATTSRRTIRLLTNKATAVTLPTTNPATKRRRTTRRPTTSRATMSPNGSASDPTTSVLYTVIFPFASDDRVKMAHGEPDIMSDPTLNDEAQRRFPVPDYHEIPDDLRERIDEETERAGFTPNVFAALAYKPSHFRAFMAFHDALVDDTALDREEVEMIVVAVSGVNHCYYCNVAHGALVRIYAKQPDLADQLVANYRQADVSEKRMAMLDVAVKLTERPTEVSEADLERLRDAGYSDEEIWDIGSVTAFFNLSNRMALFADWRPNDEFHTMGR